MRTEFLRALYVLSLGVTASVLYWLTYVEPERNAVTRFLYRVSSRRRLSLVPEPEGRRKIFWIALSCSIATVVVAWIVANEFLLR